MALRVLYLYEKRGRHPVTEERYTFRSKLGPWNQHEVQSCLLQIYTLPAHLSAPTFVPLHI
jgi:hypothetical protein